MVRSLFAVAFVLSAGVVAADDKKDEKKGDEKDNAKLIVGKWEITKAGGDVGPGSTLEFAKDKKLTLVIKAVHQKATLDGTYKLDKDRVTLTLTVQGNSFYQTLTIKKLTDEA